MAIKIRSMLASSWVYTGEEDAGGEFLECYVLSLTCTVVHVGVHIYSIHFLFLFDNFFWDSLTKFPKLNFHKLTISLPRPLRVLGLWACVWLLFLFYEFIFYTLCKTYHHKKKTQWRKKAKASREVTESGWRHRGGGLGRGPGEVLWLREVLGLRQGRGSARSREATGTEKPQAGQWCRMTRTKSWRPSGRVLGHLGTLPPILPGLAFLEGTAKYVDTNVDPFVHLSDFVLQKWLSIGAQISAHCPQE